MLSTSERHEVILIGCSPTPMAHYLKAFGVLRVVSEQADSLASGFWRGNSFVLISCLDRAGLLNFFANEWKPVPLVSPWNAGGGFYFQERKSSDKDPLTGKKIKLGVRDVATEATRQLDAIVNSKANRLADYAVVIKECQALLARHGYIEAPGDKESLVKELRNQLSDSAIKWLDASLLVLTNPSDFSDQLSFPPLLGTGGNDGNLDFSHTFRSRLASVIDYEDGSLRTFALQMLTLALFNETSDSLEKGATAGQFFPMGTGGTNGGSSFKADSLSNPWDFLFMLEGAILFAASSVKKLESQHPGALSYPFSVRQVSAGYGSATDKETDSRNEIWMPLWERPVGLSELVSLLGEGRSELGGRRTRNATDFARAVASLGVDRGITSFQRYGFLVRNGLAYFATPLGRFDVKRQPQVDLLPELDQWLDRFRNRAQTSTAPTSVGRSLRNLENAIMTLCQSSGPSRVQGVLIALGECEATLAASQHWAKENFLGPIRPLSPEWLSEADDGSVEFRLAASLASSFDVGVGAFRRHLEPIEAGVKDGRLWVKFAENASRSVVWRSGSLVRSLGAILERRMTEAVMAGSKAFPDSAERHASLIDIAAFIDGRVDETKLTQLLWGLILMDWPAVKAEPTSPNTLESEPGAAYAMLKLCFTGFSVGQGKIPLVPAIAHKALAGQLSEAVKAAATRLRGSGVVPAVGPIYSPARVSNRIGAALLFPVAISDIRKLMNQILHQ